MKNRHWLNQRTARTCVFLILGNTILAGEFPETPVHDLDPYPVEARLGEDQVAELQEAGVLMQDPFLADRAGVLIPEHLFRETAVSGLEDLLWLIPGARHQARFGNLTVPTLRGDATETLFNGQRRGDNLFGIPPTRTLMEAVEVIKGPPPIETGLGKRTGGGMNLTTPQPQLARAFSTATMRIGSWVPEGGSFTTGELTMDSNLPLGETHAIRLILGMREDETYYHRNGGADDYRDLYAAWRGEGSGGRVLDLMGYVQRYDHPQTLGVNRPWQGLVDEGSYFTGEVESTAGDSQGPFAPGVADPGLLVGGADRLVRLGRDRVLMSRGDSASGDVILGQARLRIPLESGGRFYQSVLVEQVRREKENQFYYAEDVDQLTIDSRTALEGERESVLGALQWEGGMNLRLEERHNLANYWNEFAYAFDLTEGRRFSSPDRFAAMMAPGAVAGPDGRLWYLPSSGFSTPESTDSRLRQAGVYGQIRQELGEGWELRVAARADRFWIEASEPGDLGLSSPMTDKATQNLLSGSLSVFRRMERAHIYLTAAYFRGIAGNTVGDGVNLHADGRLHRDDFLNHTRLIEVGGTYIPHDRLHVSATLFAQERKRQEFFASNNLKVRGGDLSVEWRLAASTRFMTSVSHLDARYDEASPAEFGGGSLWNVYAEGAGPTGEGNGLGYIGGFFLNSLPPGDYRIPGLSQWQASMGMEHRFSDQWLLWVWGTWNGTQDGNLAREYTIPPQWEWNASLSWEREAFTVQVVVRNLLDAENWIHNGDTFFNQMLVSRNLPLRLEFLIRKRF